MGCFDLARTISLHSKTYTDMMCVSNIYFGSSSSINGKLDHRSFNYFIGQGHKAISPSL